MGSGDSKDKNVDVYYEVNKQFYFTGEMVEGVVHINAKADINYHAIYIRLEGHEYCHWSEGSGKNRRSYTGNNKLYENEHLISKFDAGLRMGHYSFPFSLQIPAEFPGSYLMNNNRSFYILFPLSAVLTDYTGKNKAQTYTYDLTVIEPPRRPNTEMRGTNIANPKVCCCCDQGTTQIEASFSQTNAVPGDRIRVRINANNRDCKQDLKKVQLQLIRHLFVQSNGGSRRDWESTLLLQETKPVQSGMEEQFDLEMMIPQITNSTAIGTIVANYYTMQVKGDVGGCICCCGHNDPKVFQHLYIQSTTPEVEVKPQIAAPPGWSPQVSMLAVLPAPGPYTFNRNPNLMAMNRLY